MNFKVELNGEDFPLRIEESTRHYGFTKIVYVEAESEAEAERLAIEVVRADERLRSVLDQSTQANPVIYTERVTQVDSPQADSGYAFYEH